MIFDPINRAMWLLAVFTILFCGVFFINQGFKKEGSDEKSLMFGFGLLFIGNSITRLFYFISDFFIIGFYDNDTHIFYGNFNIVSAPYSTLIELGYITSFAGFGFFFYMLDRVIKKTKSLLSFLNILFIVSIFVIPPDFKRTTIYIFVFVNAIFSLLYFLWLAKISNAEFQAVSILILIGFILYIIGTILDTTVIKRLALFSPTMPALFLIVGTIVAISPLLINPKFLAKSTLNWIIFASFIGVGIIALLMFALTLDIENMMYSYVWIVISIGVAFLIFVIYQIIKTLKPPEFIEKIDKMDERKEILQTFIKPNKITEEEITFHKEQKICLVCKTKVSRRLYLCPSCDALYCIKCSAALSDLENHCWVCEAAIDETKPVFLPDKGIELKPLEPIKHKHHLKKETDSD